MTFEIPKEQVDRIFAWRANHKPANTGAIGGRYTYSFTETTLGVVVKVKDNATGKELDLTNYLEW